MSVTSSPGTSGSRPRRRRLVRLLVGALVLLPIGVSGFLAWWWEAFATRSWTKTVDAIVFTDDGRTVAFHGDDGTLRLLEVENPLDRQWGSRRVLPAPKEISLVRAFGPDRILAVRSRQGTIHEAGEALWLAGGVLARLADGARVDASIATDVLVSRTPGPDVGEVQTTGRRLSRPEEVLWAVPVDPDVAPPPTKWLRRGQLPLLSPDGRWVALLGPSRLKVRDALTGEPRVSISVPGLGTASGDWVAFDGEGATLSGNGPFVRRYDLGGARLSSFTLEVAERPIGLCRAGGRLLTRVSDDRSVQLRDTTTGERLWSVHASVAALAPDGTRVAYAGDDGRVSVVRVP